MEIIRLYNDVLMSVLLCLHTWQHYCTPTFVCCMKSETKSGSLLFRRWKPDNFPYGISSRFTWTFMTNYITGFDYETYTDKAIPFVSFSLSLWEPRALNTVGLKEPD